MPTQFNAQLGTAETAVQNALTQLQTNHILDRIWQHDHTVWQENPTEISNRLGWLDIAPTMRHEVERLNQFTAEVKQAGYTHAILIGMGGSSLAPELFDLTFGQSSDGLELAVLDTTNPDAVRHLANTLDPHKTLFIVATKSGGTVETLSGFKYFYNWVMAAHGREKAGHHFVAITDPGSKLVTLAEKYNFRATFINNPNIGGRYSVLSFFGLLPAALVGVDVARLLDNAIDMMNDHATAAHLGAIMGTLAQQGRDKLTLITSPAIASFADWVEQLVAESTGKHGVGILPIVGESLASPTSYGDDRLFVHLKLAGDDKRDTAVAQLQQANHPLITITLPTIYDLGGQFFLWELATAVAGHLLHIQPFDQPNVEAAKIAARQMVQQYHQTGHIPTPQQTPPNPNTLAQFLAQAQKGDYIALQAYVQPTPTTLAAFRQLQNQLRHNTGLAVTFGFGPRFLHSTGQLHKGDSGNGLFIQFTSDNQHQEAIPDSAGQPESAMSFNLLIRAQALGDGQALQEANRRFLRFHITGDVPTAVHSLITNQHP